MSVGKATLFLALALGAGCVRDPLPAFEAIHVDSRPHPAGFVEVFRVSAAREEIPIDAVAFTLDGDPIVVAWTDGDGSLDEGDGFSFVADAFDRGRRLEATRDGAALWAVDYRGGAGEEP